MGQKFGTICSISHRFRGFFLHIFAFCAEIHDGSQQWLELKFWEKLAHGSLQFTDPLRAKIAVQIGLSRTI